MADAPGTGYRNRTDLATQPVKTNQGQGYGTAKAQQDAQRQQPIAGSPTANVGNAMGQMQGLAPGEIPSLSDPTANPNEPLTAGLPIGPGPGVGSLKTAAFGPQELSVMRGLFLKYPNDDLRRLIEWTESNLA